jgi:hypothetical protein
VETPTLVTARTTNDKRAKLRVAFEEGKTWTFATAVDWPGWCRRGKGIDAAVEELDAYRDRYQSIVTEKLPAGAIEVIGRVPGGGGTDFGAPMEAGPWDDEPIRKADAGRLGRILQSCWNYFDHVVSASPAELRKGPRGGGRDRDKMVDHVREAERSYASRFGVRVPPRTPWPEQRTLLLAALNDQPADARWPLRYAVRRVAWHVTDHAWEMEDRRI